MKDFLILILKSLVSFMLMIIIFFFSLSTSTYFSPKIESYFFQFGNENGQLNKRSKMFTKWVNSKSNPKVLFIGPSSMYRNYNPSFLNKNLNGFNIGSSGMNISIAKDILESFIELDIEYFVLDINPLLWSHKRFETRKNWIQDWSDPTSDVVFKIAFNSKRSKEILIYLYSIIKYKNPFSKYYPLKTKNKTILYDKGTECVEKKDFNIHYKNFNIEFTEENYQSLLEIDKMFIQKNKRIFYVINPIKDISYDIKRIPVPVIDFNEFINLDSFYFNDELHLNCQGMEIFSKKASEIYLKKFG